MQRLRTRLRASASRGAPAALSLDFLSASGALDHRITFSRGSNATLTDSTGKITYAPSNLLTYSEQFDNAAWTKVAATITANVATAPDGTQTADKLVENTATTDHRVSRSVSGSVSVFSIYAKAAERSFLALGTGVANEAVWFNLATGTIGTKQSAATGNIQSVGNGWYRCSVLSVAPTNIQAFVTNADNVFSYTGDGTSGIFIWGAQLSPVTYQTTPGTYNSTTPKNLLGFTQEFDNAAWTKTNATVTANAFLAPDGTLTADKLVENTAASAAHWIDFSNTTLVASGSTVTASVYLKAGERTWVNLNLGTGQSAYFNLANGTVGTTVGTLLGTSITSAGNGWWRCSVAAVTAASTGRLSVYIATGNGTASYTGDGTSGIYIWGAQLSDSASLDPYVYNPAAAAASAAYYGPRFDYDPLTLAAKGLLIEEQRTNLLTYSADFTNAAWTKIQATVSGNTTLAPDGTTTADTLVGSTNNTVKFTAQTGLASTTGTFTVYAKAAGETVISLWLVGATVGASFTLTGSGSTALLGATSSSITPVGNGWYRCTVQHNSATTTAHIYLRTGSSFTGDGTSGVFLYGAQLEAGSFATSYIPTVASQVTRSADVAQMLGANFSSWFNQNEGTFVVEASGFALGSYTMYSATDNSSANRTQSAFFGTSFQFFVQAGGAASANLNGSSLVANVTAKIAGAYKTNDFAASLNGGAVSTDTSGAVPVVNRLGIGHLAIGAMELLNGHIRSLGYYNTRQPNATLQTLTNPSTTPSLALNFISDTYTVGA
jgi:hypothetical protein